MAQDVPRKRLEALVLGLSKCGKSSYMVRAVCDNFEIEHARDEIEFMEFRHRVKDAFLDFNFICPNGVTSMGHLAYYFSDRWNSISIIHMCVDLSNLSLSQVEDNFFGSNFRKELALDPPMLIVGLKSDLADDVDLDEFCRKVGAVDIVLCSAKTGDGIEDVIEKSLLYAVDIPSSPPPRVRRNRNCTIF